MPLSLPRVSLSLSVDSGATLLSLTASPKCNTPQTCVLTQSAVDALLHGLVPDASLEYNALLPPDLEVVCPSSVPFVAS